MFTESVDDAFERYNEVIHLNIDPFSQLDKQQVDEERGNEEQGVDLKNKVEQELGLSSAMLIFAQLKLHQLM